MKHQITSIDIIDLGKRVVTTGVMAAGLFAITPLAQANFFPPAPKFDEPKFEVPKSIGHHHQQPNILLITVDDYGYDASSLYTKGKDVPPTPTLEALAADGITYNNSWSMPSCTTTRGTIMTGKYPSRTNIIFPLGNNTDDSNDLDTDNPEKLLPYLLREQGYRTKHIGKWHLTDGQGPFDPRAMQAPLDAGYDNWTGIVQGAPFPRYFNWPKVVDGSSGGFENTFTSIVEVDETIELFDEAKSYGVPAFAWLSFTAPHFPYQPAPKELVGSWVQQEVVDAYNEFCQYVEPNSGSCHGVSLPIYGYDDLPGSLVAFPVGVPSPMTPPINGDGTIWANTRLARAVFNSLVSAFDTSLQRLFGSIDMDNTVVVFVGDNGTQGDVVVAPFDRTRAKGSFYELGIKVPLVVSGPGVRNPGRRSDALVNVVDLYKTLLDIAGVKTGHKVDSISFAESLTTTSKYFSPRTFNIAEQGYPDALIENNTPVLGNPLLGPTPLREGKTIRDKQYKLIVQTGLQPMGGAVQFPDRSVTEVELYDLKNDLHEEDNLLERRRVPSRALFAYSLLCDELQREFKTSVCPKY
ncbi:sulfatase-like hydrolase/transferase [Photobacterium sp. DNB22_13_2]